MIRARSIALLLFAWALSAAIACGDAQAYVLALPSSLAQETLSESVPAAFAPADLDVSDFTIEWEGSPIPGVELSLMKDSIQWVRVADLLVLPRARLNVKVDASDGGRVSYADSTEPLANGEGRIPIALLSGPEFPIEVKILRGDREVSGRAHLRFQPRSGHDSVLLDPSCSRFALDARLVQEARDLRRWAYIGCRQQISSAGDHRTAALELYVFWDQAGKSVRIGKVETPASPASLWLLRLPSAPGKVGLQAGEGDSSTSLLVRYSVPENLHLGALGLGLGPYSYHFDGLGDSVTNISPMLTLYGSYFITETVRIVAFDATMVSKFGSTDFGVYLSTENFRILDRRFSINLQLGGHALAFAVEGNTYLLPGLPQGLEFIYTDAFRPGYNLSFGAFIYPSINEKSYYNVWLRWGSKFFAELNYIAWEEKVQNQRVYSRSLGASLGIPIAQFL